MLVGVPKESFPGERRVALVPSVIPELLRLGMSVAIEHGAGASAGYPDVAYTQVGAQLAERATLWRDAEVILMVRGPTANPARGDGDLAELTAQHTLIGFLDPLGAGARVQRLAQTGASCIAMELVPRTSRAQSMDALSSMASLAGYKAVLLAATQSPRLFPMMMTAAGTVTPAKVVVLGAGVAGLSAIATAKRLGAVVLAYDVRAEVREQVQSVGGKFIDLGLDAKDATDQGGYAKAQSAEFYARQQERLGDYVRDCDVLITTAAVPGKRAPVLVSAAMQHGMRTGAVVVDLACETGGNCELTRPGESYEHDGVMIMGPSNLASSVPFHASQLYAKNLANLLVHLTGQSSAITWRDDDDILRGVLVARGGHIVHPRLVSATDGVQRSA